MPEHKTNPPIDLELYADHGDSVHWFAGGDPTLTPIVGVVISKSPGFAPGTSNLTLALLTGTGIGYRDGVLHMSNDRCRRQGNSGGGWAHRPIDLVFKKFMLALGALRWDGKEDFVADETFDPFKLGTELASLTRQYVEIPLGSVTFQEKPPNRVVTDRASGQSAPPPPPA